MVETETMGREKTFNIRLSEEEWGRLELLARHFGVPVAGVIRMLVLEKHREVTAAGSHKAVAVLEQALVSDGGIPEAPHKLAMKALKGLEEDDGIAKPVRAYARSVREKAPAPMPAPLKRGSAKK